MSTTPDETAYLAIIVTANGGHFATLLEPGEGNDDPLPYVWDQLRGEKPTAWTGVWLPSHGKSYAGRYRTTIRQPETRQTWAMFNPDLVSHVEAEVYEETE